MTMAVWYAFNNFSERNACNEAKVVGTCCYVNENNNSPPRAVRQYWDGSWINMGDPMNSVYPPDDGGNGDVVRNIFYLDDIRVRHKAGKSGSGTDDKGPYGLIDNIEMPWEAEEAWLDYEVLFEEDWDWFHSKSSGKIFGLSSRGDDRLAWSKNGTGNCSPPKPESYSSRCTFKTDGYMQLYAYHQNRPGECGHKIAWSGGPLQICRRYRITQRLKVNDIGSANGEIEIWVDGGQVLLRTDMEWRGACTDSTMSEKSARALISAVKRHNYFGGDDPSGPRHDCHANFYNTTITNYAPDFSIPIPPRQF